MNEVRTAKPPKRRPEKVDTVRVCIKSHNLEICDEECPLYNRCWGEE